MAVNRINQINQVTVIAPRFPQSFQGPTGPGVPAGGNVNDLLRKTSAVNYETAWSSATSLGILQTADIGSTVQAFDADLQAIAGLTSAADRLPYYTGSQTAALATFTGFARNLLDDADAATARTTLGVPGLAVNNNFTEVNVGGNATSLAELKARSVVGLTGGETVTLNAGGRSGVFAWVAGDQSANVAIDLQQGIWVAPDSDPTGASGAWRRVVQSLDYNALWFGLNNANSGISDDGVTLNVAAFQRMIDFAKANVVASTNTYGAGFYFPRGLYRFTGTTGIVFRDPDDVYTHMRFYGDGGYIGEGATQFIFVLTAAVDGMLLSSTQHFEFSDIEFLFSGTTANTLIKCDAENSPVFSGFTTTWNRCGFRAFTASNPQEYLLDFVNTVLTKFNQCWIGGTDQTMRLGTTESGPPSGPEAGGAIGSFVFDQCQIYVDIVYRNINGCAFRDTIFARRNATTPVRIYPDSVDFTRGNFITFDTCITVSQTDGVSVDFFTQGVNSRGLIVHNCRFTGYRKTLVIGGLGFADVRACQFAPPTNVAGCVGIEIAATAINTEIGPNDYSPMVAAGFPGVTDNRLPDGARWPRWDGTFFDVQGNLRVDQGASGTTGYRLRRTTQAYDLSLVDNGIRLRDTTNTRQVFYQDTATGNIVFGKSGDSTPAADIEFANNTLFSSGFAEISANISPGGVLRLTSTDTTIQAEEVSGKIEFYSEDVTAQTVVGSIRSVAINAGTQFGLDFYTRTTSTAEAFAMRINHLGNVFIGKTTGTYKLDIDGDANVDTGHVYRVNGTQVVGARVINANIADPAAVTAQSLTDNSGGTASTTIAAIGAAYDQNEVRNAVASLAAQVNNLRADVTELRAKLVAANTTIRTHGLGAAS